MKKFYLLLTASIIIAGCQKDPSTQNQDLEINEVEQVTIKATVEGGITKTTYTEDPVNLKAIVGWEAGDKISVLYQNGGYKKTEFITSAGDGTFSGSPAGTEGGTYAYWAIYPYDICTDLYPSSSGKESMTITLPSEYTGSGANGIPMNVHTLKANWDGTYHFKHMGSVLRFKILNIPSTARHLVISNASRDLAGRYFTTYDTANDLVYYTTGTGEDGEQRSVTYHFTPNVDGSYTFYLPFGVATPSGDFTFTFKNSSDEVICSRTTTLGSLASTTLSRNTMYRITMNALSFDGYPLSSITINPTDLPSSASTATLFTISGFDFYSYYTVNESGTTIKFSGDGSGNERIYNSTSLGTIAKIVVSNTADSKYYRDNYILYAGTSADPTETTISYSATEGSGNSQRSTTYVLAAGATPYTHFALKNQQTWSDRVVGTITIYYKPVD